MARIDGSIILNPGLLRHRVTWQGRNVAGQNTFGEDVPAPGNSGGWADIVTLAAQVTALQGDELMRAQQYFALAKYKILQHFYSGLQEAMRIAWFVDGRQLYLTVLNINDPPGTGRYQNIIAKDYES